MSGQPKSLWWAIASAAVAVIGSFGPWAKVLGVISVSGTDGDGWIVIVMALVAAGLLYLRQRRNLGVWPIVVAFIAAAIAAGTAIYDWSDLNSIADSTGLVGAGWGIDHGRDWRRETLALACVGLALETRSRRRRRNLRR